MTKEGFISYYPLKQGLKRIDFNVDPMTAVIYILLSIKTRIETFLLSNLFYHQI